MREEMCGKVSVCAMKPHIIYYLYIIYILCGDDSDFTVHDDVLYII